MERRHPRNPPMRPLVLIADGHEDARALYAIALSALGFDVVSAADGEDAYQRAWTMHPDIVVTEVSLPSIGDWHFIQKLKREPRTRDILVVVMAGHGQTSVRERARREGCAAVFVKPCLPDQLAFGLRELLNQQVGDAHAPVRS
jgi:CheY-like chemotaxis protein